MVNPASVEVFAPPAVPVEPALDEPRSAAPVAAKKHAPPAAPQTKTESVPTSLPEIAAPPSPNKEAEILAIEASGALVGPKHVYDRVLADLQAIRAANPVLQNVAAMPSWTADELLVGFDAAGLAAVQAGTYAGWDCANAWYGVTSYDAGSTYALVKFGHRFHIDLLGQEYAMFPNVTSAEPNGFVGDGNDVCVSIANDKTYSYVFDQGSGDCPAGCINHDSKGFQTDGQLGGIPHQNGRTLTRSYVATQQLVKETWDTVPPTEITRTWPAAGQLASITSPSYAMTMTSHPSGRIARPTVPESPAGTEQMAWLSGVAATARPNESAIALVSLLGRPPSGKRRKSSYASLVP